MRVCPQPIALALGACVLTNLIGSSDADEGMKLFLNHA